MNRTSPLKVVVLAGGTSPERNVSLASGDAVFKALTEAGHQPIRVDPGTPSKVYHPDEMFIAGEVGEQPPDPQVAEITSNEVCELLTVIQSHTPDAVFPILHGGWGEDGRLQSLLEIADVCYVGSGPRASAVAMHKPTTKRLFQWKGIPTPDWVEFLKSSPPKIDNVIQEIHQQIGFPTVMKPSHGGSTIGLTRISDETNVANALQMIFDLDDDAMAEPWIEGKELTVTVLDGESLPAIEIVPHVGFYDYLNKYTHGQTDYICPADLPSEIANFLASFAKEAFELLGCRHFARVDFLLTPSGEPYCLEVNTLPGMTSTSLVPKAAAAVGITYPMLADKLVRLAYDE